MAADWQRKLVDFTEHRLPDMDRNGVDMQVLSITPQAFLYNQDAGLTTETSIIQNDQIAKHVRDYPKSFYGLATMPMQAPGTLNRPQARNAINQKLIRELRTIWDDLGDDHAVNVVVLTGAGD